MHSDREQPTASTSTSIITPTSPPRKKSKWDDLAESEDLELIQQKKKLKKSEELKFKLNKERDVLLGGRTFINGNAVASSSSATISVKGEASKINNNSSSGTNGKQFGGSNQSSNNNSPKIVRGDNNNNNNNRGRGGSNLGGSTVRRVRDFHPPLESCRSVYCYERLNHIEEGSYGIVFRARCKTTGVVVAIKKLKMDKEKNGFPITSLREIQTLMVAEHENIVRVREICVGDTLTQVFIVMDFIEHDLKSLLSTMPTPFLASEVKTLLLQLLSAIALCHDNWIVHRDLKTSNLLMNNRGQIKVADFGLARTYGEPLGDMTQLVVTLWYRSPELLLGATEYSTAVDMWSIGCIFGELILKEPLLPGKGEIDQLSKIFKLLGKPTEEIWPGFSSLPNAKSFNLSTTQPYSTLRQTFKYTTAYGLDLLTKLLTYDPTQRISAEEAMKHPYFSEHPLPKDSDLFNSFPSVAAGEKRIVYASPAAPAREDTYDFV